MTLRKHKLVDLIISVQEEVLKLLDKPETLIQGERDPYARQFTNNEDQDGQATDQNEIQNRDRLNSGGNEIQNELEDCTELSKLFVREVVELEKLRKAGVNVTPSTIRQHLEQQSKTKITKNSKVIFRGSQLD